MNRKLTLDELNRKSADEFKNTEKHPVHVVLDDIRSAQNVGSVFRTSDAFLLKKIHICGITAKPPHKEIKKTALGASDCMDWQYWKSSLECVNHLKEQNVQIISVEQTEESVELQKTEVNPSHENPVAVIFGNEVDGIKEEIIPKSDFCIEIPQYGTKHSLNISVCAGIAIWEVVRRMI
ncbi:MAG: RNA methyltransferase [Flavobacteriales bacterium]